MNYDKNFRKYVSVVVVVAFLFQVDIFLFSQSDDEIARQLQKAQSEYVASKHDAARERIKRIIAVIEEKGLEQKKILGKCYLLLGAIYEKQGDKALAEENYRIAREKYNIPAMEGLDLESLPVYTEVVSGKIPGQIPVESSKKPGKKKKFPWLMAVLGGAAVVVGVILLVKKKESSTSGDQDYDTRVLGIEWVEVPAGEFEMGDHYGDGWTDELPVHTVSLDAYKISRYEITFEQYDRFCQETSRNKLPDYGWGRGNYPVIGVTWYDARDFCDWLSGKTGKSIHLPTEAQWEKAARGTDRRKYPWGNTPPSCNVLNYNECLGFPMPVGSYPSCVSPYGVYDMAGNVYEWCSDWYDPGYYSISPVDNPSGPSNGTERVQRGGSWLSSGEKIRASNRESTVPSKGGRHNGFRICWD
jgi:formylglycine-generating enzyme required for sulfatase activity